MLDFRIDFGETAERFLIRKLIFIWILKIFALVMLNQCSISHLILSQSACFFRNTLKDETDHLTEDKMTLQLSYSTVLSHLIAQSSHCSVYFSWRLQTSKNLSKSLTSLSSAIQFFSASASMNMKSLIWLIGSMIDLMIDFSVIIRVWFASWV